MTLQTVGGALRVLELLAERGKLSVRDVAVDLTCSRSSAYRIVRTLQDRRWVVEAGFGSYELGPLALSLGLRALNQSTLRDVALPWMRKAAEESGETVTLSVLIGRERVCVDQVESSREIRMSVKLGQPYPLYAGASGKAILAALDPAARQSYVSGVRLARLAPNTIVDPVRLERVLDEIVSRGYVVSVAEREAEAFAVAAAIHNRAGVVGSIAICGPVSRYTEADAERYGQMIKHAAGQTSASLGGGPPNPRPPAA